MILRRLAAPLAMLLLLGSGTTAHAGWYRLRGSKQQQQTAKQQQLKKAQDDLRRATEAKQKEEAERFARQQRTSGNKGTAKIYSSQIPSSNYRPVRTERQIVTLAMKLGGSRRTTTNVSTTRMLLLRRQPGNNSPVFGWKTTGQFRNTNRSGAPELFAFNRY